MARYVEAKVRKRTVVQCEHCGHQYGYEYVGTATSDVGFFEASQKAAGRAGQAAMKDESGNFHRCPSCGLYQSWMIPHAKSSTAAKGCSWGCVSAFVIPMALVFIAFGLSALLKIELDRMMDSVGLFAVLAIPTCLGLGIVYYLYRRFIWNPNSEGARSRALRKG
jgi:hypothetical protein